MKYYLDTEFIECEKQRKVLGFRVGPAVPTIDLISLALVCEDGREFYALNSYLVQRTATRRLTRALEVEGQLRAYERADADRWRGRARRRGVLAWLAGAALVGVGTACLLH